jgi:hypothetical protein
MLSKGLKTLDELDAVEEQEKQEKERLEKEQSSSSELLPVASDLALLDPSDPFWVTLGFDGGTLSLEQHS